MARTIEDHKRYLVSTDSISKKQKNMLRKEIENIIEDKLKQQFFAKLKKGEIEDTIENIFVKKN